MTSRLPDQNHTPQSSPFPQAVPSPSRTFPPPVAADDSPMLPIPGTFPTSRPPLPPRPASKGDKISKRPATRIIRTFEEVEVEVEKTIMAEEWYEELECGICSHILGAPHALVPCGHSFCGVCAWQWIKTNKNRTCPHCRMEVFDPTPIVPNIIVDQIIERKLRSLPEGKQKAELLLERKEKGEAWKAIQAANMPKQQAKKPRGFGVDDILGFFETPAEQAEANRRRRASRHFAELGAPLGTVTGGLGPNRRAGHLMQYGGMSLGDIRRMEVEEEALATRMEVRRLREALYRDQTMRMSLGSLSEEPMDIHQHELGPSTQGSGTRAMGGGRSRTTTQSSPGSRLPFTRSSSATLAHAPLTSERIELAPPFNHSQSYTGGSGSTPETSSQPSAPAVQHGRPAPLRSSAFAARQARGRSRGTSRDHPLVVLSDSEGD